MNRLARDRIVVSRLARDRIVVSPLRDATDNPEPIHP